MASEARIRSVIAVFVGFFVILTACNSFGYGYEGQSKSPGTSRPFYLSFSIGEGSYFNYKCSSSYGCDKTMLAPLDFEILLGYKIAKYWYLDIAVNYSLDVSQKYYNKVTYLTGARPGLRLVLPGAFFRNLYFRMAVPIQYTIDENNLLLVGLLVGVGIEWRFGSAGIFAEADLAPYFVEVYPGYYVIPAQARLGVSTRF
jgi:hypothetical protein